MSTNNSRLKIYFAVAVHVALAEFTLFSTGVFVVVAAPSVHSVREVCCFVKKILHVVMFFHVSHLFGGKV